MWAEPAGRLRSFESVLAEDVISSDTDDAAAEWAFTRKPTPWGVNLPG